VNLLSVLLFIFDSQGGQTIDSQYNGYEKRIEGQTIDSQYNGYQKRIEGQTIDSQIYCLSFYSFLIAIVL
jgi:DNA-directed RNA polymerase subunit N (RpoN/RPB10)